MQYDLLKFVLVPLAAEKCPKDLRRGKKLQQVHETILVDILLETEAHCRNSQKKKRV